MSGHNKFSKIKNIKAKNDAATGKVFTKIGREIAVAVKEGGPDPNSNAKLKNLIAKARANNMPNDNINRSIKRASGELGSVNYEPITYEGYGPAGSALIVEALTDNKNRTASDVRHLFDKFGGSLGSTNCVSYLFSRKGIIVVPRGAGLTDDDIMMHALEAGADDAVAYDTYTEVITSPENFDAVKDYFESNNIPTDGAELDLIPASYLTLPEDKIGSFLKLVDALEDNDDVQEVYHNVELPEEDDEE
ncbi:MAG: YebC/PmpR family DNA-binding transcriptional regulator [Clostridia bacterium]|nr:YebC/PmpR family DNA-binding transcriptional regulator [Clostridia bacterium]